MKPLEAAGIRMSYIRRITTELLVCFQENDKADRQTFRALLRKIIRFMQKEGGVSQFWSETFVLHDRKAVGGSL